MRKVILIGLTALSVAVLVFVSCLHDPDLGNGGDNGSKSSDRLTKEEAQSVFERHFAAQVKTRSGSDSKGDLLVDFDYTPLWYDGKLEHNDYSSLMTVPILTDRVMYVGYYGDGGDKPTRVARVTQELHIVKNFEKEIVMPTVKTVVPLNGIVYRKNMRASEIYDYYSNRTEVTFYQTLDGRIITTKLIENGAVTIIAYIGEDADSYREKMSRVYSKLHGYGYSIGQKRIATRGGLEDYNDSGSTGSDKKECVVCQGEFDAWDINDHNRRCNWCPEWYSCGDDHTCYSNSQYCELDCNISHKHNMRPVEVTGYGCYHCKKVFYTVGERDNHYCYCQTCDGYYQFCNEFNPHVCPPKAQVCGVCIKDPCICNQNPGGNVGGGNPNPDPEPDPDSDEDSAEKEPCSETDEAVAKAVSDIVDKFRENDMNTFISNYQNAGVEYAQTLNYDSKLDEWSSGEVLTDNLPDRVNIKYDGMCVATIHNHPTSNNPHSILDVYGLAKTNGEQSGIKTSLVVSSDGSIYALFVEDSDKAQSFYANKENNQSNIQNEYSYINQMLTPLQTGNIATLHALAYILEKHDTGMKVLKLEKNGFRVRHTEYSINEIGATVAKLTRCK